MFSFNLAYMQSLHDTQSAPHHSPHPKFMGQPLCQQKSNIETNTHNTVIIFYKSLLIIVYIEKQQQIVQPMYIRRRSKGQPKEYLSILASSSIIFPVLNLHSISSVLILLS